MKYQIYKFEFQAAVHFGTGTPASTSYVFSSDTLFSALCQEAVKRSPEELDQLVLLVRNDRIRLSDGFPFIRDTYYLPKPVLYIGKGNDEGNSVTKKAYKNMHYIAVSDFSSYLTGNLSLEKTQGMKDLGKSEMKVSANVRCNEDTLVYHTGEDENTDDTLPYRIGIFRFQKDSGLYIIVGYEEEKDLAFLEDLLVSLSFSGIGGRRSAGLGRFNLKKRKMPQELDNALEDEGTGRQMLLSQALPTNDELTQAMEQATYTLVRRGGFISSPDYADEFRRKKDLYVFAAGSIFHHRFKGDIYDVGDGGRHPVYHYAKPLFLRLNGVKETENI